MLIIFLRGLQSDPISKVLFEEILAGKSSLSFQTRRKFIFIILLTKVVAFDGPGKDIPPLLVAKVGELHFDSQNGAKTNNLWNSGCTYTKSITKVFLE